MAVAQVLMLPGTGDVTPSHFQKSGNECSSAHTMTMVAIVERNKGDF
jgi:hypothetical protein